MKILYLTSNGGIHDYRFLYKIAADYNVLLLHYCSSGIISEIQNIKGLKIISKKPFIKSFPLASEYFHFKKCVADFKPDIIHSGYVWQVGILPAYLDFHPHLSMPWGSDILVEPGKNSFIKMLTRKTIKQSSHIQCDAEFVKQKIVSDYKVNSRKITVFPWGIDLNIFKTMDKTQCRKHLKIDNNDFVVVFNRALENIYGIENLLEGYLEFSKNKNNVKLLIISDGSKKNNVSEFLQLNNLKNKVEFIGRIKNDELPVFLNAANVYISTALSDGTSLSLLEAMATGLGIIVTAVPSIKEWVNNENGIITGINDSIAVSNALEKYYNDRTLLNLHGEINLKIAKEKCNWDANYEKLKIIYANLTENVSSNR